jgi:hypothetical protein
MQIFLALWPRGHTGGAAAGHAKFASICKARADHSRKKPAAVGALIAGAAASDSLTALREASYA